MTLVETLQTWDTAVTELDQQNVASALSYFKQIPEPSSKIIFNIACCYELIGRLTDAKNGFEDALSRDEHLVIAYFQRACVTFQLKKYKEAAADFSKCHERMMGKKFIDYGQLGLRYKLHECEPLHNAGVSLIYSKDFIGAIDYLLQAQKCKVETKHQCIDKALEIVNGSFSKNGDMEVSVKLIQLPPDAVFRPPKAKVANLKQINFLKESKVVAAASEEHNFTGFVGRHKLEAGELVKAASAPNSPLAPRRGANKSPTAVAAELGKIRKAKSPEPVRRKAPEAKKVSAALPRTLPPSKALPQPPTKALPQPPGKALPVPPVPNGKSSNPAPMKPPRPKPVPAITVNSPSQPDVRPKEPKQLANELLKKQLQNMKLGQVRQLPKVPSVPSKNAGLQPSQANGPPPLPPKAEPQQTGKKKRKSEQLQRPPLNKAPPPPPKPNVTGGNTCDTWVEKPDPNLVTIDLICYSTVTIKVDRGTSLENLLDVAASISDFHLKPATFDLWCAGPNSEQVPIKDEEMMQMLWMEKEEEQYLPLWCYATQ